MAGDHEAAQMQLRLDDDTGAETLARYTFQELLAAEMVVEMLAGKPIQRVVCESDEDYVIVWRDRDSEYVSVKHREPDQGEWTLSALCSRGGLRQLFETWKQSRESIRCRLQTNAGLKTGEGEARRLADFCRDEQIGGLEGYLQILKTKLGAESEGETAAFLTHLRIQDSLPKRDDLRPRLLDELRDQFDAIGWSRERQAHYFDLVCSEVHRASSADRRAQARTPTAAIGTSAQVVAATLAAKTVDVERVYAALRQAEQAVQGQGRSLLEQKLECGGLGPTGIRRAHALREHWLRTRYRWSSDLPGDATDELRRRVLRCADMAERDSAAEGQYGALMQSRLEELLSMEIMTGVPAYIDDDALLGLAYDETDRCNVLWCKHFIPETLA